MRSEASRQPGNQSSLGRHAATVELFPMVYNRLHELAGGYLRRQHPDHTFQPTDLVHETFIVLADRHDWKNRDHLLGVAAMAMREVLVDDARHRAAIKRGGGQRRVRLNSQIVGPAGSMDAPAVHEALASLKTMHSRQAQVVELRFFGRMTIPEAAVVLEVSESTVEADWRFARAWLSARLTWPDPRS